MPLRRAAPMPPNLRAAEPGSSERCGSCKMFDNDKGVCWGYANTKVSPAEVCDSYSAEPAPEQENAEEPMETATIPTPHTREYRREKAQALSRADRRRPDERPCSAPLELRTEDPDTGVRVLRSYASLFDEPYTIRSSSHKYVETVERGAFKRTLGSNPDVVLRLNHSGAPLAATWNNTLRLGEDKKGLWYEADLQVEADAEAKSLSAKIDRGDLRESSFAFRCVDDKWNDDFTERNVKVAELDRGDVSVVTFGASRATGNGHMLLRSEEALDALRDLGFPPFLEALTEWRNYTLIPVEERTGKVISSTSLEVLRQVLALIEDADEAVDAAGPLLADLMGIPDPDIDSTRPQVQTIKKGVTNAPQLGRRSEEETRKAQSDLEGDHARTTPHLVDTILSNLGHAAQHCTRAMEDEVMKSNDGMMFNLEHLSSHLDESQVHAHKLDKHLREFPSDPETFRAERDQLNDQRRHDDFWDVVKDLAEEVGWSIREDGSVFTYLGSEQGEDEYWLREDDDIPEEMRADLSESSREKMSTLGAAMPDGSYAIPNVAYLKKAIRAFGRSKNKPAVKSWIKRRARVLGATNLIPATWRGNSPPVALVANDTDELRFDLQVRGL